MNDIKAKPLNTDIKDKGGCEIFGRDFKQWPRLGI